MLREYRTRLIADVVTGKLDVREAAARLPDEVDEPEPLDEIDVEPSRRVGARRPGAGRGMTTDTSERGLEDLIVRAMTGHTDLLSPEHVATETSAPVAGGTGWLLGDPHHYDRDYCVDLVQLRGFVMATQEDLARRALARHRWADAAELPRAAPGRDLEARHDRRPPQRRQARAAPRRPLLRDAVAGQREGGRAVRAQPLQRHAAAPLQQRRDAARARPLPVRQRPAGRDLRAEEQPDQADRRRRVQQYQRDRDQREKLFELGRCVAHFAVDDAEVRFCTQLKGKSSWFLPFNRGWNDGAGNPPNPDGLKTDYLWKQILTPRGLTDILENYAQVVTFKDEKTGKKRLTQIWPRYHQLDVVRRLLADAGRARSGQAVPDPALGGERQVELDRLARSPADRA